MSEVANKLLMELGPFRADHCPMGSAVLGRRGREIARTDDQDMADVIAEALNRERERVRLLELAQLNRTEAGAQR